MFEGAPNPENAEISKDNVIESLRNNLEDLSPLNRFLDKREAEVKNSKDALALNIEVAEIYRDSGLLESAKDAFTQAAEQAWQEHDDALHEQLIAEADKIQS
ncbi:MAG: hypothetical protein WD874_01730 [Parcubacteria group bacterium]